MLRILGSRVKSLDRSHYNLRNQYDQSQERTISQDSATVKLSNLDRLTAIGSLAEFDQIELDRYSDLHPQLQELMETIVQIQEVTSDLDVSLEQTHRTARDVTRTSQSMQTQITQIRMRPFADLANRFPRVLRDLCLEYGKSVELEINGDNTLIDRTVLDALSDPLLHLLRNAFDHGIEDPQTRQALGKSPQGQIELTATYRGNQTVITLRDDGGGINLAKVREKAIAMGFDPADLDGAKLGEILDLIFEPGFSTVEQVSELSGRGVGMDIVRTQLQKVQGQVQVETEPNVGTTFTLILPFTLSVVRVLLVESAGLLLAFPTNDIEEMILADPAMVRQEAGQEILDWEGLQVRFYTNLLPQRLRL
jgi:chemosensory pili system protein ChpA (sensor histidine kinase/response regulator)